MQIFFYLLKIVFWIIQLIIASYLLVPFVLLLCYGVVKLIKLKTPFEKRKYLTDKNFEFGIIITAHQETTFIIPLVDSILKQTYKNFHVYIVADDCDTTLLHFNDSRITVLSPTPALNAKIKSIEYALNHFIRKHDGVIILDADNLIHPKFLQVINQHFQKGYKVVQADFKPKNTDSVYARMDAIGDMFNFFIEREARMHLGLSSAIWGSGIAIDTDLYKGIEYKDLLGGFDKKLQSHLMQQVDRIAFAPDAILFDEKVTNGKSLENQRIRWISSYFKYFKESLLMFVRGIKKLDFNLAYFGYITLRPPLFIIIGSSLLMLAINYFVNTAHFIIWIGILLSFLLSFLAIILIRGKEMRFIKTVFLMPLFMYRQVVALLKLKKAKKSFIKTEHSKFIYIDDLI